MMRFHLRTVIVLLLLSFTAGFITCFLTFEGTKVLPKTKNIAPVKELKKDATNIEVSYQKQIDDLNKQNIDLQFQLQVSQSLLDEAKEATLKREKKIKNLIEEQKQKKKADDLLSNALTKQSTEPDKQKTSRGYVALFDNNVCDSLAEEVQKYMAENHRKDSIYEVQLSGFDSVISIKDKIIQSGQTAYNSLNTLFQKSLSDQNNLALENKNFKKQLVSQKVKSKIFTAALFVLSGFTANYMLRH